MTKSWRKRVTVKGKAADPKRLSSARIMSLMVGFAVDGLRLVATTALAKRDSVDFILSFRWAYIFYRKTESVDIIMSYPGL